MLYIIAKIKFLIIFKLFFRLKVTGQQNIPQDGPFIIVANHSSLLDPVILGVSVRPKVIFVAAAYLFEIRWLGYLLRKANSIPVQRENDIKAIKQTLKILQQGGIDRHKNNLPVKAGAAYLATKIGFLLCLLKLRE